MAEKMKVKTIVKNKKNDREDQTIDEETRERMLERKKAEKMQELLAKKQEMDAFIITRQKAATQYNQPQLYENYALIPCSPQTMLQTLVDWDNKNYVFMNTVNYGAMFFILMRKK